MSLKRVTNRATRVISLLALISLLPLAAASAVDADGTWTIKSPAGAPSGRQYHAMAWLDGDQALLFGGNDGARDDETWVYDLSQNSWKNKFPDGAPPAREGHAMAWLGGDQVLLFGGSVGILDGQTWVYDLSQNTWTNQNPPPPSRPRDTGMPWRRWARARCSCLAGSMAAITARPGCMT